MAHINRSVRCWTALAVWIAGLVLFFALGWWNLASSRMDAENRLINEAGRTAAQIASLLTLPGARLDAPAARAITSAAMEDDSIYAIRIETRGGIMEGQRRNHLWEPVGWDGELAEDCVQGMNPIRIDGRAEGIVEVWLSPRMAGEEGSQLALRERLRFLLPALLWTCALGLLFWYWGDLRRWRGALLAQEQAPPDSGEVRLGLGQRPETGESAAAGPEGTPLVSARSGREFQRKNPDAWLVTAGMFRQTFGRAPVLISRLYAEGSQAGLCRLGHTLEQAAPCIGAKPLAEAARKMQAALNDPDCAERAFAVEECARVLEQTLAALGAQPGGRKD